MNVIPLFQFFQLAPRSALARVTVLVAVAATGPNVSATEDAGGAGPLRTRAEALSPVDAAACSEEIRRSRAQWKYWPGDVHAALSRLGGLQKELFEGRCAGHPKQRAYLENANKLLEHARKAAPPDNIASSLPAVAADTSLRKR
jgi:hypothetical protein